jgi:ParB-like chromosome segregation protein Spo0J
MKRDAISPLEKAKASFLPVDSLIPYARNARTHSDAQIAQLAASMVEFGFTNPVIADERSIIAGHGRVLAARKLYASGKRIKLPGGEELPEGTVPVIDCTGWTEAQRKAYVIADNKLAMNADWDWEMLAVEVDELRDLDFSLPILGFTSEELNELIGTPNTGPDGSLSEYSSKIEAPTYTPKGDRPEISALFNREKMDSLLKKIDESEATYAEKQFMTMAACRHVVFDYHQIAEFYCHASPEVQSLMEDSALVIIDFDKAIELGYVQLSKKLADIYSETQDVEDEEDVDE